MRRKVSWWACLGIAMVLGGTASAQDAGPPASGADPASVKVRVTDASPAPATRMGPGSHSPDNAPPGAAKRSPSRDRDAPAAGPRGPDVQLRALDRRIQVAQERAASYQRRLAELGGYNAQAQPEMNHFAAAAVMPRPTGYAPTTVAGPVQVFSPASSFAHVLHTAQQKLEEAQLEVAALRQQRTALLAPPAQPRTPTAAPPAAATATKDDTARREAAAAELRLLQARQQSYAARLQQIDTLSQLTYGRTYGDLRERLRLQQVANAARIAELQDTLAGPGP